MSDNKIPRNAEMEKEFFGSVLPLFFQFRSFSQLSNKFHSLRAGATHFFDRIIFYGRINL